jgi:hypothetical protein
MILRARGVLAAWLAEVAEVWLVVALWTALFILVSALGLLSTRTHGAGARRRGSS